MDQTVINAWNKAYISGLHTGGHNLVDKWKEFITKYPLNNKVPMAEWIPVDLRELNEFNYRKKLMEEGGLSYQEHQELIFQTHRHQLRLSGEPATLHNIAQIAFMIAAHKAFILHNEEEDEPEMTVPPRLIYRFVRLIHQPVKTNFTPVIYPEISQMFTRIAI